MAHLLVDAKQEIGKSQSGLGVSDAGKQLAALVVEATAAVDESGNTWQLLSNAWCYFLPTTYTTLAWRKEKPRRKRSISKERRA